MAVTVIVLHAVVAKNDLAIVVFQILDRLTDALCGIRAMNLAIIVEDAGTVRGLRAMGMTVIVEGAAESAGDAAVVIPKAFCPQGIRADQAGQQEEKGSDRFHDNLQSIKYDGGTDARSPKAFIAGCEELYQKNCGWEMPRGRDQGSSSVGW